MSEPPTIAVVIPNYNGAATLAATLDSVCAQTHRALDILVVDDGSTDDSPALVERHAARDDRIHLLRQRNGGVASARNHGWRTARADLIAFIDSDDLWAPSKLARQLAALDAAGPDTGLAYCGYRAIDAQGHVIQCFAQPDHEGDVLDRLMRGNFVGNGSAVLVRRWLLERTGGFEPALHHAGAQGCEDYLFCLRAAEHSAFAAVPQPLVGYRQLGDAMSANGARMLKSWLMVVAELGKRHPGRRDALEQGLRFYALWVARRALFARRPAELAAILRVLARHRPALAAHCVGSALPRALARRVRPTAASLSAPAPDCPIGRPYLETVA
ncbi:glycosyltransferase family 2 protein [Sphingomonas sp.]